MKVRSKLQQEIIQLALWVQEHGKQRALNTPLNSRREAEDLKALAKKTIQEYNLENKDPITDVELWIWNKETSGGSALTPAGNRCGWELRFSYKKSRKNATASSPGEIMKTKSASFDDFDLLFDQLADEALCVAEFSAAKPRQKGRIPGVVKEKVFNLWQKGICYPDPTKMACFRMADSKKGKGGPYNWFSYSKSDQTIAINWEYFVQIAAFHDLMKVFGYQPNRLTFEYHESQPPVWLAVDIGVILPDGRKIFVEVKERQNQWEALIAGVKALGQKGVELAKADRGNDPLRKAKYILAGRPDFFVGYCPEGFDSYKVEYPEAGFFNLQPASLPSASATDHSIIQSPPVGQATAGQLEMITGLLDFLQEGFREPERIIQYLKTRGKCDQCLWPSKCKDLLTCFQRPRPWDVPALDLFSQWCKEWYSETPALENAVSAFFTYSRIAEFLSHQMGLADETIIDCLKIEFKGTQRKKELREKVPPCLWKGSGGLEIRKNKLHRDRGLACDFYLKHPFPPVVGEIKLASNFETSPQNFIDKNYKNDLAKCERWLTEAHGMVEKKFGIAGGFSYALAILIDLTGGEQFRDYWHRSIIEKNYVRRRIIPRLISPAL